MSVRQKEFSGTVLSGQTVDIPLLASRSFMLREIISSSGVNVSCPFKIGNSGSMPADYVNLQAGFCTFIPSTFDRVQVINRRDEDIFFRFIVSPDILSDSRVYGSVQCTNGTVPNPDPLAPPVMVPIFTRDYKTQEVDDYSQEYKAEWPNYNIPYIQRKAETGGEFSYSHIPISKSALIGSGTIKIPFFLKVSITHDDNYSYIVPSNTRFVFAENPVGVNRSRNYLYDTYQVVYLFEALQESDNNRVLLDGFFVKSMRLDWRVYDATITDWGSSIANNLDTLPLFCDVSIRRGNAARLSRETADTCNLTATTSSPEHRFVAHSNYGSWSAENYVFPLNRLSPDCTLRTGQVKRVSQKPSDEFIGLEGYDYGYVYASIIEVKAWSGTLQFPKYDNLTGSIIYEFDLVITK